MGEAVLEFTSLPRTGCSKFAARYGDQALTFISTSKLAPGRYVKVVQERVVRASDHIEKATDAI